MYTLGSFMEIAHTLVGLVISFYSDPLICMPMFLTTSLYNFAVQFEIGECDTSFSRLLWLFVGCFFFFFLLHKNFRIVSSSPVEHGFVTLIGIALNLYHTNAFGNMDILTTVILPMYEHGIFFNILCLLSSMS